MPVKIKLKILMLSEYYPPFDQGGSEWSTIYLARSLVKKGHRIMIFTPNYGTKPHETRDKIEIIRFPFRSGRIAKKAPLSPIFYTNIYWWFLTTVYLYRVVRVFKPSHIHIQGKYFLPAAILIGKLLHIPVILTVRDYILLCPFGYCIERKRNYHACSLSEVVIEDLPKQWKINNTPLIIKIPLIAAAVRGWVISWLLRKCLSHCDKVVTISNKMRFIHMHNGVKIDAVIYNSNIFTKRKTVNNRDTILFSGRLTYGKGVEILTTAYNNLYTKIDNLPSLLIVGSGPLEQQLKQKKSSNVYFYQKLKHSQLMLMMQKAHFVIVPSIWEEPFGRVALEALYLGTPVLATNRGALPEIVTNKITGMVVNPTVKGIEKGIKYLLGNEAKLRGLLKKNRLHLLRKFTTDPIDKYEHLYSELL